MPYVEKLEYEELENSRTLDHKLVKLSFCYSKFAVGKGTFRCPQHLHLDHDYCQAIRQAIRETVINHLDKSKVTAEQIATLTDHNLSGLPSTCEKDDIMLEVLLFTCKERTKKFLADRKVARNAEKNSLLNKLASVQQEFEKNPSIENGKAIDEANTDLDVFFDRQELISRQKLKAKWVTQGDRPSSWYLNLQKARSAANAIPLLRKPRKQLNGLPEKDSQGKQVYEEIRDQSKIIEEIGDSYANIFRKRTREPPVPYISLKDFLTDRNTQNCPEYPKLSNETRNKLEADLTLDELGKALKNLNNGSSPGLDGFCAGWLKCFWAILGPFVFKAIIYSKNKEHPEMSAILRMALITLIPKGDKDRTLLGNWRPISLLSIFL